MTTPDDRIARAVAFIDGFLEAEGRNAATRAMLDLLDILTSPPAEQQERRLTWRCGKHAVGVRGGVAEFNLIDGVGQCEVCGSACGNQYGGGQQWTTEPKQETTSATSQEPSLLKGGDASERNAGRTDSADSSAHENGRTGGHGVAPPAQSPEPGRYPEDGPRKLYEHALRVVPGSLFALGWEALTENEKARIEAAYRFAFDEGARSTTTTPDRHDSGDSERQRPSERLEELLSGGVDYSVVTAVRIVGMYLDEDWTERQKRLDGREREGG
jgi:hypothetical protein